MTVKAHWMSMVQPFEKEVIVMKQPHEIKIPKFLEHIRARRIAAEDGLPRKFVNKLHYAIINGTFLLLKFGKDGDFILSREVVTDPAILTPAYLVLLTSSKDGWVYSKREVLSQIDQRWIPDRQGRIRITVNRQNDANQFATPEAFLRKIKLQPTHTANK